MTKQDILGYLNSLRKSTIDDITQRWIDSYNGRQMILSKFFKWLYNPEPDQRNRLTSHCMKGIKQLPRKEKNTIQAIRSLGITRTCYIFEILSFN